MTIMTTPRRKCKLTTPPIAALALAISWEILAADGAVNSARIRHGALRELDNSPSLHFAALGDWGAHPTSSSRNGQLAVADGVASWLDKIPDENGVGDESAPFILSLGDNFYPAGVNDLDDMAERFADTFEEVYSHDAFDNVPWYAVAGNHDYRGNITAQMNYPGSSRWIFPDHFHRVVREVRIPGGNIDRDTMKVEILAIDSIQLADSSDISLEVSTRSTQWIQYHLQHSDADYLIVAGHYPARMTTILDELLPDHRVSAYVSGHDHCQKHEIKNGVNHFISGAGMEVSSHSHEECRHGTVNDNDYIGGFLSFHAGVDKMVVVFRDETGTELQSVEVAPRNENKHVGLEGSIEIA
eukprot:CAMPEP_0201680890 /NCGR_PEP_ID=MMETSP0494-20130426/50831_1 /ASSEMBLY_ACC=CAM_ASM_000839 /TAXON_ID=420259 /ORGANISM="Thalassiosira gravida, Strain GMp14c1" /LENGTH=355 /DNA_ID=CAMNT_0048164617 /DNA_START=1753 /DNA_END=2820 /DNA_ORIENTATION=-